MKLHLYRLLLPIYIFLICNILVSSCIREGIEECPPGRARIKVDFDYSYAGIPLTGTTILFYPSENIPGTEIVSISTHNSSVVANLLPGEYSVLVINETFGDFSNIRFRNTQYYNRAEAYARPIDNPDQTYNQPLYYSPDILVVDTLSTFIVTPKMVEETNLRSQSTRSDNMPADLTFTLRRAVAKANVTMHIKQMKYISTATTTISGFSEGYYLADRHNNETHITHGLENIKLSYNDETKTDGTIKGTFNTFGLTPGDEQAYRLTFDALLVDGKTKVHKEFDISDIIKTSKDEYGVYIDIELGTKENPAIVIPEVETEEGTSPFDPDVDDWENEEEIEVPMP